MLVFDLRYVCTWCLCDVREGHSLRCDVGSHVFKNIGRVPSL